MSACAWYCSIMLRPPPPGTAFGLVTEYHCSANQVKPFSCNPSNTWQWSLTNMRKPLTNPTIQEKGPYWGQTGLVLPTEHFEWPEELVVCARPAKTDPACGCWDLCPAPYFGYADFWWSKPALELGIDLLCISSQFFSNSTSQAPPWLAVHLSHHWQHSGLLATATDSWGAKHLPT